MTNTPSKQVLGPAINRLADLMVHCDSLAFKGVTRLAREAGVSPSAVSRLMNGKMNPSFLMVARLTDALERRFGFRIDPRELVAENGCFLTPEACRAIRCQGCLPDAAWDESGVLKDAFADVNPGEWSTSQNPKGYPAEEGK